MARLVLKNEHDDTCYNEIGLCAQNKDTILGIVVNINERTHLCDLLKRKKNPHF